jgi:hypothetical protein
MGIEPKRTVLQSLRNASYREVLLAACDWRANFHVKRDNVGLRETTPRLQSSFRCRSKADLTRRRSPSDELRD